ncbi:MAG: bifunctional riboflavin kinase/FAD synthetase [Longimicrobiales bacterium]
MSERAIDPALPSGLPDDGRGTIVTIGTFDGVHRGHWEVLKEITSRAAATDRRSVLVTFHPHPLTIVRPEVAPPLLTTPDEKKEILAESGLDYAVFIEFSPVLAGYSPRRFVEEILMARVGMDELVIGYDHHFGKGRSGDAETMRELGGELGFAVDIVGPVMAGGAPISSTRIRTALAAGDVGEASEGLGRPYSLRGLVVRGDGRGRTLGFPTANLHVDGDGPGQKLIPPPGIYAVWGILRSGAYAGALHVGPRPTFRGSPPTIELHLMDFEGDIYGEDVRVDFVQRLRDVEPFDSVKALVAQMRKDVDLAQRVLEEGGH